MRTSDLPLGGDTILASGTIKMVTNATNGVYDNVTFAEELNVIVPMGMNIYLYVFQDIGQGTCDMALLFVS